MNANYLSNKQNEERLRFLIVCLYALFLVLFGLFLDSPRDIFLGMKQIVTTQDTLITDYFVVGGMGASFLNAGLVAFIFILLVKLNKVTFSGATLAVIFLGAGFSLFGKNIFNIWPIILGVYLYARYVKAPFANYIYVALFGTALAPIFSEILYYEGVSLGIRIPVALGVSLFTGFILPPLSTHFLRVHQGYNLYNVGFTAGIIGMLILAIGSSFGFSVSTRLIWSSGNNTLLLLYLYPFFLSMVGVGIIIDRKHIWSRLKRTFQYSGRMVTDLIVLEGTSTTLINMGLLGTLGISYILVVGGDLNGPTIGGILSVAAFGAFGKNLKNTTPILIGVMLGAWLKVFDINDPAIQLAALFGTSLAPIAGEFGILFGILAGFLHSSVVINVGHLHGGLNLYNNGFSAGFVAAVIVPIIEVFREDETD